MSASSAAMAPKMKSMKATAMAKAVMSKSALAAAIAEACEIKPGEAKKILEFLADIATKEVKKNAKFTIPGVAMLKTRRKPATKAGKREMCGKIVKVKAKPAKTVVKAFAVKAIKDEF